MRLHRTDPAQPRPLTRLPMPGYGGGGGASGGCGAPGSPLVLGRLDGGQRVVRLVASRVQDGDDASLGYLVVIHDCTSDYQRLQRLAHESTHDHLTNLVDRRELERRLEQAIRRAERQHTRHVLMFMDLDHFKQVNDRLGHLAGDSVLRQVAETLRTAVRERDTLGRLGGDELGLLMEHCSLARGLRAAETLIQLLRRHPPHWDGQVCDLGISIGLTVIDRTGEDLGQVWARADAACYEAKRSGGGRCHVFRDAARDPEPAAEPLGQPRPGAGPRSVTPARALGDQREPPSGR